MSIVDEVKAVKPEEHNKCELWELEEKAGRGLTSDEKDIFFYPLVSHANKFAKSNAHVGRNDVVRHFIHTGNAATI